MVPVFSRASLRNGAAEPLYECQSCSPALLCTSHSLLGFRTRPDSASCALRFSLGSRAAPHEDSLNAALRGASSARLLLSGVSWGALMVHALAEGLEELGGSCETVPTTLLGLDPRRWDAAPGPERSRGGAAPAPRSAPAAAGPAGGPAQLGPARPGPGPWPAVAAPLPAARSGRLSPMRRLQQHRGDAHSFSLYPAALPFRPALPASWMEVAGDAAAVPRAPGEYSAEMREGEEEEGEQKEGRGKRERERERAR